MYNFLLQAHSGFRYVVSILLILAVIISIAGWLSKSNYSEGNRKLNLFTLISAHIQLLLGLALYFVSPFVKFGPGTMKDDTLRYWTVEHITMMIIAIVLITIGHSKSKKALTPEAKHKTIAIFYTIALIIIILAIYLSKRGFF
jgi:membrane protein DedA with SNARE-associated domain